MDADRELRRFLGFSNDDSFLDIDEVQMSSLVLKFSIWPSTTSFLRAPWLARYALRRQRHRVDARAPGPKRDLWGMPDEAGYFADDNSLLKGAFRNLRISGEVNPYADRKISTGLVCCHIWPNTTSNPLLFSFLPNLVWLPKSIARFTDVVPGKPIHKVHYLLQELSYLRYRRLKVLTGVDETERAWKHLERPSFEIGEKINLNVMESEPSLSNRVNLRHTRLLSFLNAAIEDSTSFYPRFSKRYHLGHGAGIDGSVPQMTKLVPIHGIIELRRIITETFPKT